MEKLLIGVEEAAEILGIGAYKVKRYCYENYEGFPVAAGKTRGYRIQPDLLRDWIIKMVKEGKPL